MTKPLLEISNLAIDFKTSYATVSAVREVNLTVMPGETVAIVGESGSGKSTTAMAILDLLAENAQIKQGQILFEGEDLVKANKKRIVQLRGNSIGLVPQDPMSNLNPVWKIGFQVKETLQANGIKSKERVFEVLREAGLTDVERRAKQYPHEFSGGMRQRALIAIGLSCKPKLLIADEPTSALDVTVQRQILDHLAKMTKELKTAVLLITHDLGLAAQRAEKVVVMYKGKVVEAGSSKDILCNPKHPYTQKLINSAPSLSLQKAKNKGFSSNVSEATNILEVKNLRKVYKLRTGLRKAENFYAVDDVSFVLPRGKTVAIVGESGSGKSTVAQLVLNLQKPTAGKVLFEGREVAGLSESELFKFRRRVQVIFQDPYGSLDPMYSIYRTIEEPLRIHNIGDKNSREKKVRDLLDKVALPQSVMRRYPNELSGGQRQRVAIARALALEPEVIVCDEAVSALDVLVQAQVLEILLQLQEKFELSYIFITHDLAVVHQIAHEVCVMRKGKIVEFGSVGQVFANPQQQYTRELLAAIPGADLGVV